MLAYVSAAILLYIAWQLIRFIRYQRRQVEIFKNVPLHPANHWILGVYQKVRNHHDLMKLYKDYIDRARPTCFHIWMWFLWPGLVIVHPKPLKDVLSAIDLPKNRSIGGPYLFVKPWLGEGLLISGVCKWERNRHLLTSAFHFDILKPYVTMYHDVADIFLDKMATTCRSGASVNIYPHVSKATLDTMLRCTLSYRDTDVQMGDFHPYVNAIQRLMQLVVKRTTNPFIYLDVLYNLTSDAKENGKLCDFVHKFADDIIERRRESLKSDPSQLQKRQLDFVDILLTAKDQYDVGLTHQEIREEVDNFMLAGHDTTASAISWILHSLAKYPDMQQRVRQEVEHVLNGGHELLADDTHKLVYTTCVIKESLRMYTPVPSIGRTLKEPLEIDGTWFPAGTILDIELHMVHHHPDVWENHMEFRPERFMSGNVEKNDPFAFTPFSAGQRNCIGQNFAMNEIKVIISRAVSRFQISLDTTREAEPFPEIIMRPKDGIYLKFQER